MVDGVELSAGQLRPNANHHFETHGTFHLCIPSIAGTCLCIRAITFPECSNTSKAPARILEDHHPFPRRRLTHPNTRLSTSLELTIYVRAYVEVAYHCPNVPKRISHGCNFLSAPRCGRYAAFSIANSHAPCRCVFGYETVAPFAFKVTIKRPGFPTDNLKVNLSIPKLSAFAITAIAT